jgi:DNA-binding NtrC family response regulator
MVLIIGLSHGEGAPIRKGAEAFGWKTREVRNYREAILQLCSEKAGVMLCSDNLPDGTWEDILSATATDMVRPRIIVISRHADERLWAEVLDLGGFDVLASPCDEGEVVRAVEVACRNWRDEWHRKVGGRGIARRRG